jgi:hypothetical protein
MYHCTLRYSEQTARAEIRANLARVIRHKVEWKRITALLSIAAVLVYSYWKGQAST